jgi:DNA polymerase-1
MKTTPLQRLSHENSRPDIHTITASKIFVVEPENVTSDMRRTAKMVNFGIIYRISAFGLSQRLAIPCNEAAAIIEAQLLSQHQKYANYPKT